MGFWSRRHLTGKGILKVHRLESHCGSDRTSIQRNPRASPSPLHTAPLVFSCHGSAKTSMKDEIGGEKGKLRIALAGNANVGKSLSGKEYVYVSSNGQWKVVELGKLVNELLGSSATKIMDETIVAAPRDLFVMSLNLQTLKVERKKVTCVLRHREGRKLLHLETSSGRTLTATRDHNFIVLRRGIPTVEGGKQLSIGDQLPVVQALSIEHSTPILDLGDYLSRRIEGDNKQYQILDNSIIVHGNRIPRFLTIDNDLARFFGLYLAEGSITSSFRTPRISTSNEKIRSFVERVVASHHVPFYLTRDTKKSSYDIGVSKVLEPILQKFGSASGEKRIPSFVYRWSQNLVRSLLRGYFEGDGWRQATATHAATKSMELQLGLVNLLALTNSLSRLRIKRVAKTSYYEVRYVQKPCERRAQWLERIRGIGLVLRNARKATGLTQLEVVRKLGWKAVKGTQISALENERRSTTKQFLGRLVDVYRRRSNREDPSLGVMERLASGDVVWDDISDIYEEDADDGYVYDLSVEDNESFMLASGIFVHNSVIFNQLTGLHQHIGNWPGKTVERAEGTLHFKGYTVDVVDLPGIYSLSTFSIEELVSREYIIDEKPDLVIDVVDATLLERNLFFTLQLMELGTPLIIALNQIDLAKRKGIKVDLVKLEKALGVSVVPTCAVKGMGIYELLDTVLEAIEKLREDRQEPNTVGRGNGPQGVVCDKGHYPALLKYGNEVEERINKLLERLERHEYRYPCRYLAVKLLEGDKEIRREVDKTDPSIVSRAEGLAEELEGIHNHSCSAVIASERYDIAGCIARSVQVVKSPVKPLIEERLHNITTGRILGYPIMILTLFSMFYGVFTFGGWLSTLLTDLFYGWQPVFAGVFGVGIVSALAWSVIEGVIAGITVVLPYIIPFYVILYVLENSGYLSRIAFLMDNLMHRMGLHGKAFIPMMLAYGCNVPACLGCRIMETERERLLAAFVTTLVPCAARTIVILGLVGYFVGIQWALGLYALNLVVIFLLGRLAFKALPGEPTALIMEMADYKLPHMKTVFKQTWFRVLEFIKMAFPIIIAGSFILKLMDVAGLMQPLAGILSPVTVLWLGLPAVAGIALIFGVLRKELTLVMLAALLGTTNFALVLTPVQMIVFTIVVLFYVPCVATIGALIKEFGWKKASFITVFEILFAITLGGIALRILIPLI